MKPLLFLFFFVLLFFTSIIKSQNIVQHDLVSSKCSNSSPPPADTLFYNFKNDTINIQLIRYGHACQKPISSIQLVSDTLFFTIVDTSSNICATDCSYIYNFRLYGMNDSSYVVSIDDKNYSIDRVISGLNENTPEIGFKIYPNPSKKKLKLELKKNIVVKQIQLYSIAGKLIKEFDQHERNLDIEDLPRGVYILELSNEKGIMSKKVIIE